MAKYICGGVAGAIFTLVGLTLFTGLPYARAERQLIDDWRQIQPGMASDQVVELLGEPSYDFRRGEGFPEWASQSIPINYSETHGLLMFYVPAPGPQFLLVYIDEDDRVSFVSSAAT